MNLTSLWSKVALSCFVLGCLFLWLLLYEVPRRQNASINLHAQTELESIAQVLAVSVKSALDREDLFLLQELQDSLWENSDAAFAAVYLDEDGHSILVAAYPSTVDEAQIDAFLQRDTAITATAPFTTRESQGRVVAGLVEETNRARTIERLVPLYASALLLFLVAMTLLVLLRRRVIAPLQEAARYATRLNEADYHVTLRPLKGQDEVAMLQRALVDLTHGLQDRDFDQQRLTRTLKYKVKELEKANRDAENSLAVKQRFVANVSHEIRTPLNGILGLSHLLLQDSTTSAQKERVQKIIQSGEHLLQIIDDILDYSKINAGKLVLHNNLIVAEQMVHNIIAMVQPLAAAKKLELIVDSKPDFPAQFYGDQQRLTQILLNFLNNAIKFTSTGFVMLELALDTRIDGVPGLCFKVLDTGPGLSEADQAKLFQEFQQVDNSLTREAGGTGLGLAISRKFAELMGGSVAVVSTLGVGSCFEACIPLQHAVAPDAQTAPEPAPEPGELTGKPLRVLVVDDNPLTSRVVSEQLGKRFMQVVVAKCGADGMQQFIRAETEKKPFDVVVMDWLMPAMDGISAATYMRAFAPPTRELFIIGMSASADAMKEALKQSDAVCFDKLLPKPVLGRVLADTIHALIHRTQVSTGPDINSDSGSQAPAASFAQFPNTRVLLVEDNDINQEVAVGFLQKFGLTIDIANNGREALTTLEAVPPDHYALVFMDIQMPVMDGLTAAEHIRAQPRFDKLPLIAMTASANTSDRQDCLDAGMNDYLSKPMSIELLYSKIFRWLRGAKLSRPTAVAKDSPGPGPASSAGPAAAGEPLALKSLRGLDIESALFLCAGDETLLRRIIVRLCETWPTYLEDLQQPLLPAHKEALVRVTHTLVGLCANIGAQRAEGLARQANSELGALDWSDADAIVQLRALLNTLQDSVEAIVEQVHRQPAVEA